MPNHAPDLVLYYYPYSFYSQKVVMALQQMKIKYIPRIVDIHKGKQFNPSFLAINPKGEVPVLVDDVRIIPDSEKIVDYLEDNFANGNPGLLPKDRELRARAQELHQTIHDLNIEALSYGAAIYDDLGINPKAPYNCMTNRSQMLDYLHQRPLRLQREARKHPAYAEVLNKKLEEIEEESKVWQCRENYEGLLISIERVLDECEAELSSHESAGWWLCTPEVSIADVDLSILLYRMWQLGFERRMWEKNRPHLRRYYARVQHLESFHKAITMTEGSPMVDFLTSPVVLGILGTTAIVAGGYYLWNKKGAEISAILASLLSDDNEALTRSSTRMAVYGGKGYTRTSAPKPNQFS